METLKGVQAFFAPDRQAWRDWLTIHHLSEDRVWLIISHKNAKTRSVTYEEAVEEALCFGWIDSIALGRDGESKYQYFSKRKAKSNWSRSNRERVERLLAAGLMAPAGIEMVNLARKSGTWEALTEVQNSVIPPDLQQELDKNPVALENFEAFTPSSKRIILEWILNARKPETRSKRIMETVTLAAQNIKANHYRQ